MKPTAMFFVLMALLLTAETPVVAEAIQPPGKMVMVGEWHGEEVSAGEGETWFALHQTATGYALLEVIVSVELVEDEVIDLPPEKTGKKVSVAEDLKPLVLLRGLPQLKEGLVVAAASSELELRTDRSNQILFDGRPYWLSFHCDEKHQSLEQADCPLQLSFGSDSQTLQNYPIYKPFSAEASIASDVSPRILWSGDLDRDGRLDLLLDLTNHYNVSAPTLLLSGLANDGELVGFAAVFRTTGC